MNCEHCGAALAPVAQFCGRCGRSVGIAPPPVFPVANAYRPEPEPEPEPEHAPEPEAAPCAVCGTRPEPVDRYCGECGHLLGAKDDTTPAEPESPTPAEPESPTPRIHPVVLQFSTGESVSVAGSGLLGRNPRPEPEEVVDHIVIVTDPTRSVSKTHLEFGYDSVGFWVSDRHSGNGTVVREPGQLPRYCEPGRRYHVARGTRVDMGDQFVIIG